MKTENVRVIKCYVSKLDSELVLATVSTHSGKYFADVLGEQLKNFTNESSAIRHVEEELKFFYISRDASL
jgi:hypothetical protein